MNTQEMFGEKAKWLSFPFDKGLPLIRDKFVAKETENPILTICGLGFFDVFINGKRVGNDFLKPAFSDYSDRDFGYLGYPLPDKTSHRIYVERYEIGSYLSVGENVICVILCPGWYGQRNHHAEGDAKFSDDVKLCYSISDGKNTLSFSGENTRYSLSHITKWNLYKGITSDFSKYDKKAYLPGYDDGNWVRSKVVSDIQSPLYLDECPADREAETLIPNVIAKLGNHTLYDAGKNVSGFATFKGKGRVKITYAEELKNGIFMDFDHSGGNGQKQIDTFLNVTPESDAKPYFRWNGFRYFRIDGNAMDVKVEVLHIPFRECSYFNSDNEILNKLFDAYKLTQLNNMHAGVPSDCPHRERLGYTGDGQLTTETALLCFDAESFYRKWIDDICDCQDVTSGHVQHTAPFMGGGGGPCGWGGAIILVPYKYYKVTGDIEFLRHTIPYMEKWIKFIRDVTFGEGKEYGLVVRERPKGWCLGDWCTLEKIAIPEPFVNTYYFIKCLECYAEICKALSIDDKYHNLISICKNAMSSSYKNAQGFYCDGIQGANFFAADVGLISYDNLYPEIQNIQKLRRFDTGIFGTDVLLKVLTDNQNTDLVCRLLSSQELGSFGFMFNNGGTTLWEYWENKKSHDHPMFGSVIKYMFTGIAGIDYDVGFRSITINPKLFPSMLNRLSIGINKQNVSLNLTYQRLGDGLHLTVSYQGSGTVSVLIDGEKRLLSSPSEMFRF